MRSHSLLAVKQPCWFQGLAPWDSFGQIGLQGAEPVVGTPGIPEVFQKGKADRYIRCFCPLTRGMGPQIGGNFPVMLKNGGDALWLGLPSGGF